MGRDLTPLICESCRGQLEEAGTIDMHLLFKCPYCNTKYILRDGSLTRLPINQDCSRTYIYNTYNNCTFNSTSVYYNTTSHVYSHQARPSSSSRSSSSDWTRNRTSDQEPPRTRRNHTTVADSRSDCHCSIDADTLVGRASTRDRQTSIQDEHERLYIDLASVVLVVFAAALYGALFQPSARNSYSCALLSLVLGILFIKLIIESSR